MVESEIASCRSRLWLRKICYAIASMVIRSL
ncbi:hypothetical protein X737_02450 [Mesorhizobium sp. L48C026A00]|nr:hypothetical protein X737_02450 [Mesorhizobium sp. L48C026A00]